MISELHLRTFLADIGDAWALAAVGDLVAGYDVLIAGRRRAEEARYEGEAGTVELLRRYQHALDAYAARFGVKFQ
jgi:hypothetical protein